MIHTRECAKQTLSGHTVQHLEHYDVVSAGNQMSALRYHAPPSRRDGCSASEARVLPGAPHTSPPRCQRSSSVFHTHKPIFQRTSPPPPPPPQERAMHCYQRCCVRQRARAAEPQSNRKSTDPSVTFPATFVASESLESAPATTRHAPRRCGTASPRLGTAKCAGPTQPSDGRAATAAASSSYARLRTPATADVRQQGRSCEN